MTLRFGNAEVALMSRVPVDSSTKAAAVKHYWQTGSLKGTADKFGVSRNAVYDWVRIAELNVEQAFRASTPGKKTATLSEQNHRLQAQLDDVFPRSAPAAPVVIAPISFAMAAYALNATDSGKDSGA